MKNSNKDQEKLAEMLLREGNKKNKEIAEITGLNVNTITRIKNYIKIIDLVKRYDDKELEEWISSRKVYLSSLKPYLEILKHEDYLKIKDNFEKGDIRSSKSFRKTVQNLVSEKHPSIKHKPDKSYVNIDIVPQNKAEEYVVQLNKDGFISDEKIFLSAFSYSRELQVLKEIVEENKSKNTIKYIIELLDLNFPIKKIRKIINLKKMEDKKIKEYKTARMKYLKATDVEMSIFLISELGITSTLDLSNDIKLHLYATVDYLYIEENKGYFLDKNISKEYVEYLKSLDCLAKVDKNTSSEKEDVPEWYLKISIESYVQKLITFISNYNTESLYQKENVIYPKSKNIRHIPLLDSYSKKQTVLVKLNNLKLDSLEKEDSLKNFYMSLRECEEDLKENYIIPSKKNKKDTPPTSHWYIEAKKSVINKLISNKALINTDYKIKDIDAYVDIVCKYKDSLVFYCIYDSFGDYISRYSKSFKDIADEVYIIGNFSNYLISNETSFPNVYNVSFSPSSKTLNYSLKEKKENYNINKNMNKKVINDIINNYNQILLEKLK